MELMAAAITWKWLLATNRIASNIPGVACPCDNGDHTSIHQLVLGTRAQGRHQYPAVILPDFPISMGMITQKLSY